LGRLGGGRRRRRLRCGLRRLWRGVVEHRDQDAFGYTLLAQMNDFRGGQAVLAAGVLDVSDDDVVTELRFRELQHVGCVPWQGDLIGYRRGGGVFLRNGGCTEAGHGCAEQDESGKGTSFHGLPFHFGLWTASAQCGQRSSLG